MKIAYSKQALKYLRRLPAKQAGQITDKVKAVAAGEPADVAAMQGVPGVYRLRVGDVRVLFKPEGETLTVLAIGPRGDVYK